MENQPEKKFRILETPRDAMQGLSKPIPTEDKVRLINVLMQAGFDIIDVGSLVSPKLVPQMKDTPEILERIETSGSVSKIFVLVVNQTGARDAVASGKVDFIGFPFSTSQVFLRKNINSEVEQAWKTVNEIQNTCIAAGKQFMVYLTMAFGNPYGDPDGMEPIYRWTEKLHGIGIKHISLSDIIGVSTPESIETIYASLSAGFPEIEFGIHLHVRYGDGWEKIRSAYQNGCSVFDGVINGHGGCPMTGYELLGNLPTSLIVEFAESNNIPTGIDRTKFTEALRAANSILL
jgi:hydroxymethylglutaryl-CoA lyase